VQLPTACRHNTVVNLLATDTERMVTDRIRERRVRCEGAWRGVGLHHRYKVHAWKWGSRFYLCSLTGSVTTSCLVSALGIEDICRTCQWRNIRRISMTIKSLTKQQYWSKRGNDPKVLDTGDAWLGTLEDESERTQSVASCSTLSNLRRGQPPSTLIILNIDS
jgi:hypothetical protein